MEAAATPEQTAEPRTHHAARTPPRRQMVIAGVSVLVMLLLLAVFLTPQRNVAPGRLTQPSTGEGRSLPEGSAGGGFGSASEPERVAPSTFDGVDMLGGPGTGGGNARASTRPDATPGNSATTRPGDGTVPLTVGTRVGLEPADYPGYRVRHQNFTGRIDRIGATSSALAKADSTFTVRPGLASGACVSFEAVNYPGYFLRHQNFVIYLHRNDGSRLFASDVTFCPEAGLAGQYTSLQSYNYPGRHLRHRNSLLYLDPFDGSDRTRREMTYAVRPAL